MSNDQHLLASCLFRPGSAGIEQGRPASIAQLVSLPQPAARLQIVLREADTLHIVQLDEILRVFGGRGQVDASESARGLITRIDELSVSNSGTFWHAQGEVLPW